MARGGSEVRVGFFMLIALAVAAYLVFSIKGNPFQKTFEIAAQYDRVSGVKPGTTVTLAGHAIGEVSRVGPNPKERKIEVWMKLDDKYAGVILDDATAAIVPLGFLGDVMIEITYGKYGQPVQEGSVLAGQEALDLQGVIRSTADEFRKAMGSVNDVVGNEQYQDDLGRILDNLSEFTDTLNTLVEPQDKEDLDQLFALLRETTANIGQAAERLDTILAENRENLASSMDNVKVITDRVKDEIAPDFSEAARSFSELGEKMTALTERIDTFVASNSDNAAEMITGIRDAASNFQETLDTAKTSLYQIESGPGTLHDIVYKDDLSRELTGTLQSARGFFDQFSGFGGDGIDLKISSELQWFYDDPEDTHNDFDWHLHTNDPLGLDIGGAYSEWHQSDTNRLEWDLAGQVFFGNYGLLLGADDVGTNPGLDLLFMGKVPNSGGRLVGGFGVLEGEAGARLEAHLVPDLLTLRMDAVGFTTEDKERFDLSLRGQIWKNLHVIGGFEGLFGHVDRRGFAGLRLEFGKKFGGKKPEDIPPAEPYVYTPAPRSTRKPSGISEDTPATDPFASDEAAWEEKWGDQELENVDEGQK
ncbi:MAG: MCE family protein [Candidatus Omnitrophica bacterium]|nr:MCE family protein [Candidatus Omnitrophota bacterium]